MREGKSQLSYAKFTRLGAAVIDWRHTKIQQLASDWIESTEFQTERLVSTARRQISMSKGLHIHNSPESKMLQGTGSIPKFGDWVQTESTERNFRQKDWCKKVNSNFKWGSSYTIHENLFRQASSWKWRHG